MSNISESVAAATAVVGYDLMKGSRHQQVEYMRSLQSMKLCGSAAKGDTEVELFIGDEFIGNFFNTTEGAGVFGVKEDEVDLGNVMVYPGEKIHAYVADAPTTNAINVTLITANA